MASSPIRINQATLTELQLLKGVGPIRAQYIEAYRQEVGLIRNSLDLATAMGVSIKIAERMANQIDWTIDESHDSSNRQINFWPLLVTCLASGWLMYNGFIQITAGAFVFPYGLYHLGLLLILLGSVAATVDIALASMTGQASETTRLFLPAVALCAAGMLVLTGLVISGLFLPLASGFQETLKYTALFVIMALMMIWLMYGPAICLRLLVGYGASRLQIARICYDLSLIPFALGCSAFLFLSNGDSWLEEIFCIWFLVILTGNGLELVRGRQAFLATLSVLDRSRFEFLLRHQLAEQPQQQKRNRTIGVVVLIATATLLITLTRVGIALVSDN